MTPGLFRDLDLRVPASAGMLKKPMPTPEQRDASVSHLQTEAAEKAQRLAELSHEPTSHAEQASSAPHAAPDLPFHSCPPPLPRRGPAHLPKISRHLIPKWFPK